MLDNKITLRAIYKMSQGTVSKNAIKTKPVIDSVVTCVECLSGSFTYLLMSNDRFFTAYTF